MANELVDFTMEDDKLGFRASGFVTNANYHVKKTNILLFINHRAVESTTVKRAIEQTYSAFLPKGGHPFAYINLEVEPQRVDVNVHPTKREVHFLNEDEIIEAICNEIRSKLAKVDSSRTFLTQTVLPGMNIPTIGSVSHNDDDNEQVDQPSATPKTPATAKKPYEHNLVRTDSKVRKITSMLSPATGLNLSQSQPGSSDADQAAPSTILDEGLRYETTDREPLRIALTSIKNLRAAVRTNMHNGLTEMIASHTYVGLVDERRRIAAIQSGVKLYLIDYGMLCSEFFYQVGLTDFGNFGMIKLDPAPKLVDLLRIGAEMEKESHEAQKRTVRGQKGISSVTSQEDDEIFASAPEIVAKSLIDRREMLNEYFSLDISSDGTLVSLPLLLKDYLPCLGKLPRFLLRLGPYIDWSNEQECFQSFLRELAAFYTPEQLPIPASVEKRANEGHAPSDDNDDDEEDDAIRQRRQTMVRMLEYAVFPAIRSRLVATTGLLRGVVEVADLKGLYRVFERC